MADFADRPTPVLDLEPLGELEATVAAGRRSPALPTGTQLLEANLYAVCDRAARRARRAPGSTARSTPASATRCATSSAARPSSAA